MAGEQTDAVDLPRILLARVEEEIPAAVALRRRLHRMPELAHREHATAQMIAEAMGVDVRRAAGTGLVARARGPVQRRALAGRSAAGAVNAACDNVRIVVHGRQTHAAYPHLGRDPVLAISGIVVALHTTISRRLDPLHPAVLTVGELRAGSAENVVPATASAALTVRTHVESDRETLRELIADVARSTAQAHGCTAEVRTFPGEPVLCNDHGIITHAQGLVPAAGLQLAEPWRSCGSDDFSFFAALAPIAMAFVGLDGAPGFRSRPLHHPEFLPPDEAVSLVATAQAVLYLAAAVRPPDRMETA